MALLALIFGSMVLVGEGPEVAMGSDDPEITTDELAALEAQTESLAETVTKAEENPAILAATAAEAQAEAPQAEPVLQASLGTATDAAVQAALAELPADEGDDAGPAPVDALELTTVGVVLGQRVNVRSGPSTADGVIGQVVENQEVEILGYEGNGWARILLDGEEGFMSGDFLREVPQG
ncbi:SH3 domain-containing protein [Vannielia litorea]|uniref:SH3 domain-containing protein n=1 Tax=Vannielia litorea TaxID=1217970 RepID=UPI00158801EA|nr:SH3 domain-containing protein [Vannielia litorea]